MPRVPVMTMAPQNRGHQALISIPKSVNVPACRSGMGRSASLAWADVAASSNTTRAHRTDFRLFIDDSISLRYGQRVLPAAGEGRFAPRPAHPGPGGEVADA